MDSETLELIFKAKDEATAVVNNLRAALDSIPNSAKKISEAKDEIAAAFEKLKISTTASMEAQKAAVNSAYLAIKNSATSTANEITRAEAARAKAIEQIDSQNFATRKGLLDSLKTHWLAVTGAIVAAWAAVSQAKEYVNLGAMALQAEESFKNVVNAYGVDGDRLLAKLKEVSVGAIDESAMMQRAVKALQQGLSPDQIIQLMEVARSSARVAGIDIKDAFDRITEAAANQMTRSLKALGIIIDQNKAYEDYAKQLGIAKEALNEQQQSQALANAAITEGLRQRQAMNISLVNEAEQLQINKARFEELKETIGKELLNVLGLAAKNIDAIAIALTAAALMNAPRVIAAIITALQSLTVASAATSMAIKSGFAGIAAFIGYELGGVIDKVIYSLAKIDLSGLNKPAEEAARATKELEKNTAELNAHLAKLGFTGPDAWKKYETAIKTGNIATDQATGAQKNLLEALKQTITVSQAQIQTLSATSQFYIELVKKDFETGKITMDEYVAFVKKRQDEITQAQIANAQLRIQELKKEHQMKMISEDELKTKIAVVNEEIKQLNIKAGQENTRIWDEAQKIKEQGLEKTKKTQEEEFAHWKSLQELKLQSLKSQMDLENSIDETAAQQGLMRQSGLLDRKLQRMRAYYAQEISIAEETARKIAEITGLNIEKDIEEYEKAIAAKERLQKEFEQTLITSEQQIKSAREKEEIEANAFIAAMTGDRIAMVEEEKTAKLKQLEAFWQQGVIGEQQYHDAIAAIEEEAAQKSAALTKETATKSMTAFNDLLDIIADRRRGLTESVSLLMTENWEDIKSYFGDWKTAIAFTAEDAYATIKNFMKQTTFASFDTFWNAQLYGRKMVEMVGTSIYEWSDRVVEYINFVKSLFASLQDYITSLRIQLAQLRGDRSLELELQYQEDVRRLEEQYGEELQNSAEYQEALMLLNELYAEKRKKIREQEQEETRQFYSDIKDMTQGERETEKSPTGGGGGASSIIPVLPELPWRNFAANLTQNVQAAVAEVNKAFGEGVSIGPKEIKVTKEVNLTSKFEINAFDNDILKRLAREVLFPEWERQLALKGIKL